MPARIKSENFHCQWQRRTSKFSSREAIQFQNKYLMKIFTSSGLGITKSNLQVEEKKKITILNCCYVSIRFDCFWALNWIYIFFSSYWILGEFRNEVKLGHEARRHQQFNFPHTLKQKRGVNEDNANPGREFSSSCCTLLLIRLVLFCSSTQQQLTQSQHIEKESEISKNFIFKNTLKCNVVNLCFHFIYRCEL